MSVSVQLRFDLRNTLVEQVVRDYQRHYQVTLPGGRRFRFLDLHERDDHWVVPHQFHQVKFQAQLVAFEERGVRHAQVVCTNRDCRMSAFRKEGGTGWFATTNDILIVVKVGKSTAVQPGRPYRVYTVATQYHLKGCGRNLTPNGLYHAFRVISKIQKTDMYPRASVAARAKWECGSCPDSLQAPLQDRLRIFQLQNRPGYDGLRWEISPNGTPWVVPDECTCLHFGYPPQE